MPTVSPFIIYMLRKGVFIFATFFVFLLIIFALPRAIPGNPVAALLTQIFQQAQANPDTVKAVYKKFLEEFGLEKPLYAQLADFLSRMMVGDLGTSIAFYPRKVTELVASYLPWTLGLLIPAILIAWTLGNLLGAWAAYRRRTRVDNVLLPVFLVLSMIPYYWLAMILLYVFAVTFRIFPVAGAYPPAMHPSLTPTFILAMLHHYVLPFLSIVVVAIGGWAIGMRVLVIYELRSDYVEYSELLGLSDKKILGYVFRNSILPQVTGLALSMGTVMGGALITELVFSYPGTGYLLFRALSTLDYPLIQGTFIILVFTLLAATFIVDLLYAYIDPRIRVSYVGD
ncbi:MAG: ABC transporter permease [Nitrososphaerota archaeon]|nr:ABC transporter permease [Candidatus Calditenuaceae archaeon]MDW8073424.1 ABC transporter permease [Nitrososphaerota archaeon]